MQIRARLNAASRSLLAAGVLAASLAAQAQTQTVTWRVVVFDPDPNRVQLTVQAVTEALEAFGRVSKNVGLLPSPLPELPGKPGYKTFQMGPYSQRIMTCDDAYARIDNGSTLGNQIGVISETYAGCVFPSAAGTRVVFTFERAKSGASLSGAILNLMAKTIQGSDEERARKLSDGVLANMRKVLPTLLVDTVELPGLAPERPDGAQVDSLLAAATKKPPAVAAAAPAPAPAPVPAAAATLVAATAEAPAVAGAQAVPAGASSAPATTAAPAAPSTARTPDLPVAIEARKNLTAMGMTYHSTDALHEAIRRKDRIAVQLFIDAAGVDLKAQGKDGLDAVAVGRQVGDTGVLAMLERAAQP